MMKDEPRRSGLHLKRSYQSEVDVMATLNKGKLSGASALLCSSGASCVCDGLACKLGLYRVTWGLCKYSLSLGGIGSSKVFSVTRPPGEWSVLRQTKRISHLPFAGV